MLLLMTFLTIFLISVQNRLAVVYSLQFYYPTFASVDDQNQLQFWAENGTPTPLRPYVSGSKIQLLPDPDAQFSYVDIGADYVAVTNRVLYKDPITFLTQINGTTSAVSFNTFFTFKLSGRIYGSLFEGMAFFVAPTVEAPVNSSGDFFGLVSNGSASDLNQFLALEFDTDPDSDELKDYPSNSHISVDIGSILYTDPSTTVDSSDGSANPELSLRRNYTLSVWMSFNASSLEIKVWMTNDTSDKYSSSSGRPADPPTGLQPVISTQVKYAPTQLFKTEMYVGFSGTTFYDNKTAQRLGATVQSWAFSIDDVLNKTVLH